MRDEEIGVSEEDSDVSDEEIRMREEDPGESDEDFDESDEEIDVSEEDSDVSDEEIRMREEDPDESEEDFSESDEEKRRVPRSRGYVTTTHMVRRRGSRLRARDPRGARRPAVVSKEERPPRTDVSVDRRESRGSLEHVGASLRVVLGFERVAATSTNLAANQK
jgi:hypothetical protein